MATIPTCVGFASCQIFYAIVIDGDLDPCVR